MKKTWLVLDSHFLCHRAFHTDKHLSWGGRPTGVTFGFLKSITSLKDEVHTDRVAFCFEHPLLFRRGIYPNYKKRRNAVQRTDEEKVLYQGLITQISELQKKYLPKIGFKNIFSIRGMESDDIMAKIAQDLPDDEEAILVTSDLDLLQCLKPNVSIYSPQKKRILTQEWFEREYKIRPSQWALVKAIAGCNSDEVRGIEGVGEITALRYLRGELSTSSNAYQSIKSAPSRAIVRLNRKLVQLPYDGCPPVHLQEDNVTREAWLEVCKSLGMRSIAGRPPITTRKARRRNG